MVKLGEMWAGRDTGDITVEEQGQSKSRKEGWLARKSTLASIGVYTEEIGRGRATAGHEKALASLPFLSSARGGSVVPFL